MKKIILVDDDLFDRELFEDALKDVSMQTQLLIFEDGVDLMTTLDETVPPPPYAVFLDINMPRKNGYECLSEIRKNQKLKDITVIIFSTSDNQLAIEKTYSLGANFYVCKPRSFQLLKKAIETILLLSPLELSEQPSREQYFLSIN